MGFELPENFDLEIKKNFQKHRTTRLISEHFTKIAEEMDHKRVVRKAGDLGAIPRGGGGNVPPMPIPPVVTTTIDGEEDPRGRDYLH